MKLPNPERAVVDLMKLRDYCLNPSHRRGQHKARVFASALNLTQEKAEELRDALLDAARTSQAVPGEADDYGRRFVIDFPLSGREGRALVRSIWIIRKGEDFARLVTCYVAGRES